jgi:hypothetical protein
VGKPAPTARWLRNGREIVLGGRITVDARDGVFKLTIHDVIDGDEGDYTCEASNALGSVHTSCKLRIGRESNLQTLNISF